MTEDNLVADIGLEIIYGCDRFDKYDIKEIIKQEGFDVETLKKKTEEWVWDHWPKDAIVDVEYIIDAEFIKTQLHYWYD